MRVHAAVTLVFSLLLIGLGVAIVVRTALLGGGIGLLLGAIVLVVRRPAPALSLMAKKLQGLSRVLGPRPLASVAYGEIASSLYFALGVVAYYALGFTPWVLLAAGIVFMLVALSYAEGTAAIPETGGAATLVRRAFNDPLGFMTGWALFLDYLIVIALAALFVPHYLGDTVGWDAIKDEPWDVVVGVVRDRGGRRRAARAPAEPVPACDRPGGDRPRRAAAADRLRLRLLRVQLDAFGEGVDLGTAPTWTSIGFAIPVGDARVYRTGDRRQPRRRGARAGQEPAAQPLRRDRRRCDRLRSR